MAQDVKEWQKHYVKNGIHIAFWSNSNDWNGEDQMLVTVSNDVPQVSFLP